MSGYSPGPSTWSGFVQWNVRSSDHAGTVTS